MDSSYHGNKTKQKNFKKGKFCGFLELGSNFISIIVSKKT
jgi:hypothetical protein